MHVIFHVNGAAVIIRKEDYRHLFAYLATILRERDCLPLKINGVEDHVHLLFSISRVCSISEIVRDLKKYSTLFLRQVDPHYYCFSWQRGYGAFSVSPNALDATLQYIEKQEEHHKIKTYRDEFMAILDEYQIPYDSKYLLEDD